MPRKTADQPGKPLDNKTSRQPSRRGAPLAKTREAYAVVGERARASVAFRDVVPTLTPKQAMFICAIAALGDDAYGVRIAAWMGEQLDGRAVNPGQVYGIAEEMLRDGLVAQEERDSPHGRGRPIIVYRITDLGDTAIAAIGMMIEAGYRRPPGGPVKRRGQRRSGP
jgi:DNA-binding PadR family transcriptional regulator